MFCGVSLVSETLFNTWRHRPMQILQEKRVKLFHTMITVSPKLSNAQGMGWNCRSLGFCRRHQFWWKAKCRCVWWLPKSVLRLWNLLCNRSSGEFSTPQNESKCFSRFRRLCREGFELTLKLFTGCKRVFLAFLTLKRSSDPVPFGHPHHFLDSREPVLQEVL